MRSRSLVLVALFVLAACGDDEAPPPAPGGVAGIPTTVTEAVFAEHSRGLALLEQYRPIDAIPVFEKVLAAAPAWTAARYNLGLAYLNSGLPEHHPNAQQELERVMREAPDDAHGPYALAMLMGHLGRLDDAERLLRRAQELAPGEPDVAFQLGALLEEKAPTEARLLFEAALRSRPHHQGATYRLFQLLREAGEDEAAARQLERFRALQRSGAGTKNSLNYGEMGALADALRPARPRPLADDVPLPAYRFDTAFHQGDGDGTATPATTAPWAGGTAGPGLAVLDANGDGRLDLAFASPRRVGLRLRRDDGSFAPAEHGPDLRSATGVFAADPDGDGNIDLFATSSEKHRFWRNVGGGVFTDATAEAGLAGRGGTHAVFADADHDGDLDLFVVVPGGSDQMLRNLGEGTYEDVASELGLATLGGASVGAAFVDLDEDADLDLVIFRADGPPHVMRNDRMDGWTKDATLAPVLAATAGAQALAVGDFDGDARMDLLVLRRDGPPRLLLAAHPDIADEAFDAAVRPLGACVTGCFADLDLDGHEDVLLAGTEQGGGPFAVRRGQPLARRLGPEDDTKADRSPRALCAVDLDGEGGIELVMTRTTGEHAIRRPLRPPGAHWLTVVPSGAEGATGGVDDEGRPFDPTGLGVSLDVQTGPYVQRRIVGAPSGWMASPLPRVHLGLGGAARADYVRFRWPDGVLQSEMEVPADQVWRVKKVKRKPSSCPVLFTWDGTSWRYVTDFLGTGGVGFLLEPGVYAPADPTEDVWIPPGALVEDGGLLKLRVLEPLEEVTWLDQLQLVAYDHPAGTEIWLDERFGGVVAATAKPWVVGERVAPKAARDDQGRDVLAHVSHVDRQWPEVPRERRFAGYAKDHALELDFGDALGELPAGTSLVLCTYGWIDYTYSHVAYAAEQAGLALSPPALEVPDGQGEWRVAVADIGFPAGLPRPSTYDLTDVPEVRQGRFRLRTTMEIFYDQVFLAVAPTSAPTGRHVAPLGSAVLRRVGVPKETSPDGRLPMGWDLGQIEAGVPFRTMAGAYTRFGDVKPLLDGVDDRFVTMAVGDEVELAFEATTLPPVPEGHVRTYVLRSHGYCKDMDAYGAEPETVEPVPYGAMTSYPPPAPHPDAALRREMATEWDTRVVPGSR
ncbi:MAG: FG-GAP-like repeat-containing protein [Planctomycetota bacterium]